MVGRWLGGFYLSLKIIQLSARAEGREEGEREKVSLLGTLNIGPIRNQDKSTQHFLLTELNYNPNMVILHHQTN